MSKKNLKYSQPVPSRQILQHNLNKNNEIKQFSSPNKKITPVNSKILSTNKNYQPPSSIKMTQQEVESPQQQITSTIKKSLKQDPHLTSSIQQKTLKKVNVPVSTSQNAKKFSKTSKIPTLKSTTAKGTSQQSQSEYLKNSQSKIFTQQISIQKSSINEVTQQQSSLAISTMKSQIQILKTQNDQLRKQNDKLTKKIQKLKSLNDQNKKLLKQRIQNFNSQGQNLRKLKYEITDLEKNIIQLKIKVQSLSQQNKTLRIKIQTINSPKISRQIQTILQDQQIDIDILKTNNQIPPKQKHQQKKYQSSSSRKSYGGILPLQTVIKLNAPKFKINFKTVQSTPKKNLYIQPKLMDKYQNYWSEKFNKQYHKQPNHQQDINSTLQAKSQFMALIKKGFQKQSQKNLVKDIDIQTNKQKILNKNVENQQQQNKEQKQGIKPRRHDYRKQLNQIMQSMRYTSQNYQYTQNIQLEQKQSPQGFSPTILIQNYRKISEQEQLIKSLYRVVEQLSKQIQIIQRRQNVLEFQNKQLKIKLKQLMLQKQLVQHLNIKQRQYNPIDDLKDDTLLLDQTKQDKYQNTSKPYSKPLTHTERIHQLLILGNQQNLPNENQKQSYDIQQVQSAHLFQTEQIKIIDQISRFVHSEVICHNSQKNFSQTQNQAHPFQDTIHFEQKQDKKSSTKSDQPSKNLDQLDRQILSDCNYQSNSIKPIQQLKQFQQDVSQVETKNKFSGVQTVKNSQFNEALEVLQNQEGNLIRGQNSQQPQLRIDDSLQALQYFSMHTPQNITSNVSNINDNSNMDNQQTIKHVEGLSYMNILRIQEEDELKFIQENANYLSIDKASQQITPVSQQIQAVQQYESDESYRRKRLSQLGISFRQKSLQQVQTLSKQLDQINIYQDSVINTDSMSIV